MKKLHSIKISFSCAGNFS